MWTLRLRKMILPSPFAKETTSTSSPSCTPISSTPLTTLLLSLGLPKMLLNFLKWLLYVCMNSRLWNSLHVPSVTLQQMSNGQILPMWRSSWVANPLKSPRSSHYQFPYLTVAETETQWGPLLNQPACFGTSVLTIALHHCSMNVRASSSLVTWRTCQLGLRHLEAEDANVQTRRCWEEGGKGASEPIQGLLCKGLVRQLTWGLISYSSHSCHYGPQSSGLQNPSSHAPGMNKGTNIGGPEQAHSLSEIPFGESQPCPECRTGLAWSFTLAQLSGCFRDRMWHHIAVIPPWGIYWQHA